MKRSKSAPKEEHIKRIKRDEDLLSEESDDDEVAETPVVSPLTAPTFDGQYTNKQRVLVFCSRGVTARARHLLEDIRKLVRFSSQV